MCSAVVLVLNDCTSGIEHYMTCRILHAVPNDLASYHVGSWSSKAQGESTQGSRNSHRSDNITFPSVVGCPTCLQPSLDDFPLLTGIVYTRS